jgi:hypothetical protein
VPGLSVVPLRRGTQLRDTSPFWAIFTSLRPRASLIRNRNGLGIASRAQSRPNVGDAAPRGQGRTAPATLSIGKDANLMAYSIAAEQQARRVLQSCRTGTMASTMALWGTRGAKLPVPEPRTGLLYRIVWAREYCKVLPALQVKHEDVWDVYRYLTWYMPRRADTHIYLSIYICPWTCHPTSV